ncbi:MAG: TonB-dependent receptor plug domain-containing protein [Sediminibacterium sp.]
MQNDERLTLIGQDCPIHTEQTQISGHGIRRMHVFACNCLASFRRSIYPAWVFIFIVSFPAIVSAQTTLPTASELKKLSFEELMNIEVTSVSKVPEKLTEVASAVQVITHDDIYRSTSNTLPEALRLASNLQIAKPNSHDWAISARGFNATPLRNNTLSNKLLVMIDGRSVYTPLFGGVFWDVQNVMLEDIDRVEVVSGPGGTLWGANAVNGVINVINKSAKETQGMYLTASTGTFLQDHLAARFGTRIDSNLYLRVYGQHFDQGSMKLGTGADAKDNWGLTQAGFRLDYYASPKNTFSVHGDAYGGAEETPINSKQNGQNIVARWVHTYSENSELVVQAYFDRTWKNLYLSDFREQLNTYDIDVQHRFRLNTSNTILWGAGYRLMNDVTSNSFVPANRDLNLLNTFIQDQISLIPHKLELTIGTKLLYNDYSGLEFQPSARMAWTPTQKHTLWAAVSRAVRTPSRFETDLSSSAIATGDFNSEKVIAYELGYRVRLAERISLSLASFYNQYTDLRSFNNRTTGGPPNLIFANDQDANAWGFEFSGNAVATDWWRLRGGYTYLDKKFTARSPNVLPASPLIEGLDPKNQVMLQSIMNLSKHLQWDVTARFIDEIISDLAVGVAVKSYTTFDMRIAWEGQKITFSVQGQNLASQDHTEFVTRQVPRSILAKISFRF